MFISEDKGNLTVCLNKSEHNEKMLPLFSDKKVLPKFLRIFNDKNFLKKKYHNNQLTLTGTVLAKGYCLSKVHKQNVPLRPNISLINSPTHTLLKTIYGELKNCVVTPKSHISNSFELKEKINNLVIDENFVFLSLDESSLFTNVSYDLVRQSLNRRYQLI